MGIEKPNEFAGHSMLDTNRPVNSYVMTENMGPGSPDMTTERMWQSCRMGIGSIPFLVWHEKNGLIFK